MKYIFKLVKRLFKREYNYYISYQFKSVNGSGFGAKLICTDGKIKTVGDIDTLVASLKESLEDSNAGIVILMVLQLKDY